MDTTLARPAFARRVPLRSLVVLALLAALVASALVWYVGSRHRAAPPFGPAANGAVAYVSNGDIYVTDPNFGNPTLLVGGTGDQLGPSFSPDGTLVAYDTIVNGVDHLWVIGVDGTGARQIFDRALPNSETVALSTWITWSGDSRHLAIVTPDKGHAQLWIASIDGSEAEHVDLGGLEPNRGVSWDPLVPNQLLIRAVVPGGKVDLVLVNTATGLRQQLHVPWPATFGADWDLSGHTFSDDGQRIAYNVIPVDTTLDPQGYYRIGLINRDGSNAVLLPGPADHRINEGWPVWSPDGKWISAQRFAWRDPDGLKAALAVLPADGSAVAREVIPSGEAHGATFDVTWAPDSSKLIAWDAGRQTAYLIDPAVGNRERLPWLSDIAAWQRRAP